MPVRPKSKLPRLEPEWYRGRAAVIWTHTFENRATGWLTPEFHVRFREVLLHASARHALACPAYVLMPDHWHLVWLGLSEGSDQIRATEFLREHLRPALGTCKPQHQAHDHVLRDEERKRGAFRSACAYLYANPARAGLVREGERWPYLGAVVVGYPQLDVHAPDYWDLFWRIYGKLTAST